MISKILLDKNFFTNESKHIFSNLNFKVTLFRYSSGIEGLTIENSQGYITLLPYMGQIIWDAKFKGIDLCMKNMFSEPKKAKCIIDTYGCFAFHSGILSNGCPSAEDTHIMHGEFSCAPMDRAWLEIENDSVSLVSEYEYCQGFGYHYMAYPKVTLKAGETKFSIQMKIKNLTSIEMPIQYMCHMNYAYVDNGKIISNFSQSVFKLRESIPAHVKPTPQWLAYNEEIKKNQQKGETLTILNHSEMYDPEIVFMADGIDRYGEQAIFEIDSPKGYGFKTEFSTKDFTSATRWILYNQDQQVAAFVLPATCRPEGFLAAKKSNTLVYLKPQEEKIFKVETGLK